MENQLLNQQEKNYSLSSIQRCIEASFDLNLHKQFPERVDSYSGITKQGVLELGLEAVD